MEQVSAFATVFFSAILLLLPFEASNLRKQAAQEDLAVTPLQALRVALLSISASFGLGIFIFCLVLLGPPYLLGDIIALPWLTAIPALVAGFWVARFTSRKLVAAQFARLGRTT